jgi:ribosomal protein S18 acetylase RimI-like enzyme
MGTELDQGRQVDNHAVPVTDYCLVEATESNISGLELWFADQQQISSWAGPGIAYPLTNTNIAEAIGLDQHSSFCLLNNKNKLLGFGQFYPRLNRQHLCRIAVNPSARGLGLGTMLVKKLVEKARIAQADCEISLFVNKDNMVAQHCYQALGFCIQAYPQQRPVGIENCHYMVRF